MRWSPTAISTVLLLALFSVFILPARAQAVSSQTLIEENREYNGRTVTFEGEVIGDILRRGNNAWINVNDDSYAFRRNWDGPGRLKGYNSGQAIYLPAELTERIIHLGRYDSHGDIVRVTGTFRRASTQHGGDMMIEGRTLAIVRRGGPISHKTVALEPILLLVLGAITVFYGIAAYLPSKR